MSTQKNYRFDDTTIETLKEIVEELGQNETECLKIALKFLQFNLLKKEKAESNLHLALSGADKYVKRMMFDNLVPEDK